MEELHQLLLKDHEKIFQYHMQHYNKLPYLQFVDQKHGILKFYQELGGSTMIKYLNLLLLVNFYLLVHLWFVVKETLFNQIVWKWESHYYLKLITNQLKDIWMIEEFMNNKSKNNNSKWKDQLFYNKILNKNNNLLL